MAQQNNTADQGNRKENSMTRINIFRNYGVLAAEKRNIYTYGGASESATCADEITVELPEGWELSENYIGDPLLVAPWRTCYLVNVVLGGDKYPHIIVRDPDFNLRRFELKEI